jgi:hypothetical protein
MVPEESTSARGNIALRGKSETTAVFSIGLAPAQAS